MKRIGIVAALEREVAPLLEPGRFGFERTAKSRVSWENESMVLECGGIGYKPAERAAERLIQRGDIKLLISAGVAGALTPQAEIGQIMMPSTVIDAATGTHYTTCSRRSEILVTGAQVASADAKQQLRARTGADLVDMEAAAVAAVAAAHGLPFLAIKAISDTHDQPLPPLDRFVRSGSFQTQKFAVWCLFHPQWWGAVQRLRDNTALASRKLCLALSTLAVAEDWSPDGEPKIMFPEEQDYDEQDLPMR